MSSANYRGKKKKKTGTNASAIRQGRKLAKGGGAWGGYGRGGGSMKEKKGEKNKNKGATCHTMGRKGRAGKVGRTATCIKGGRKTEGGP